MHKKVRGKDKMQPTQMRRRQNGSVKLDMHQPRDVKSSSYIVTCTR